MIKNNLLSDCFICAAPYRIKDKESLGSPDS
nr:MAG TPA: hypothetical protein [Caudoviricetes sp.]